MGPRTGYPRPTSLVTPVLGGRGAKTFSTKFHSARDQEHAQLQAPGPSLRLLPGPGDGREPASQVLQWWDSRPHAGQPQAHALPQTVTGCASAAPPQAPSLTGRPSLAPWWFTGRIDSSRLLWRPGLGLCSSSAVGMPAFHANEGPPYRLPSSRHPK